MGYNLSTNIIQTSFAGGELSPTLYARVDLAKYHIGAARLRNFFVDYRGGASNRPGFELVYQVKDSVNPERLIPFQFSTVQNYILEFSNLAIRVIKSGAQVFNAAKTITGATNANPGVFNVTAHGYTAGTQVLILVAGMTQANNKQYLVVVVDANHFSLQDLSGNTLNTAGFGIFTSGTVASLYEIVSPYAAADLALLKFTQSADTMTLTHPSYPPYDLTRTGDTAWAFTAVSIGSAIAAPMAPVVTVNPNTGGTTQYSYVITAVNAAGEESVASAVGGQGAQVNIAAVAGSVLIQWTVVAGAVSYNVYKALPSVGLAIPAGALYGFMTTITGNANVQAVDTNIVPDFTFAPPTHQNPFTSNNPIAVTYDQQRKVYAGSNSFPATFWMSKPGQFKNFDVSDPVQPSDAITGTLVSRQVNNIKYMVAMPGGLIMLTGGGAWQVSGGSAGAILSPTTINATPQAYNGCADVEPLTINYDILYVQQKGTVVRDLSYSFYTNIYTGADLSVLSNHLFTGYSIKEWTYAEEPFKIIWAVRSDGALLSLTYLKEQEVFGWAQHATQGRFQSITSIQEGQENAVYMIVQRYLQGRQVSFIERMHTRLMPYGVEDAFFVDCALQNDLVFPTATLSSSAVSGVGVQFSTNVAAFSAGDVGSIIRAGGGIATITAYTNSQLVTATITKPITDIDSFRNPALMWPQVTWSLTKPSTVFSGLDHLEGETVSILGDGNVFPMQTVLNGSVMLSQPCSKVTVGLAYTAQLQTLYLDTGDPTIQGKRKNLIALTARVDQTRGLEMGPTFDDLTSYKDRDLNTIGQPIDLFTGDQRMVIGGGWQTEGQLCIQQSNPLPATILGVIPEIQVGDTGK